MLYFCQDRIHKCKIWTYISKDIQLRHQSKVFPLAISSCTPLNPSIKFWDIISENFLHFLPKKYSNFMFVERLLASYYNRGQFSLLRQCILMRASAFIFFFPLLVNSTTCGTMYGHLFLISWTRDIFDPCFLSWLDVSIFWVFLNLHYSQFLSLYFYIVVMDKIYIIFERPSLLII